jgi:hypothetical protein
MTEELKLKSKFKNEFADGEIKTCKDVQVEEFEHKRMEMDVPEYPPEVPFKPDVEIFPPYPDPPPEGAFTFFDQIKQDEEDRKSKKDREPTYLPTPPEILCLSCGKSVDSSHRFCGFCGSNLVKPGETIDLSDPKINFSLNNSFGVRSYPEKVDSRHDLPCPTCSGPIDKDPDVQEWVFNSLPLTEEQKLELKQELESEYRKGRVTAMKLERTVSGKLPVLEPKDKLFSKPELRVPVKRRWQIKPY